MAGQSMEIIMNRRTLLAAAVVVLGTMAVAGPADAQRRDGREQRGWELLGIKKVGFIADRDVVQVGRDEGRFRAVKIRVKDDLYERPQGCLRQWRPRRLADSG